MANRASTAAVVLAVTPAKEPSSKTATKEPPRWRRWTDAAQTQPDMDEYWARNFLEGVVGAEAVEVLKVCALVEF